MCGSTFGLGEPSSERSLKPKRAAGNKSTTSRDGPAPPVGLEEGGGRTPHRPDYTPAWHARVEGIPLFTLNAPGNTGPPRGRRGRSVARQSRSPRSEDSAKRAVGHPLRGPTSRDRQARYTRYTRPTSFPRDHVHDWTALKDTTPSCTPSATSRPGRHFVASRPG